METKTFRLIAILISTLFCGLPGLCGLCFGSMALFGTFLPDTGIPQEDVALTAGVSVMMIGLSLVFIAIPVGISLWTWWSRRPKTIPIEEIAIPEDDF